MRKKNLKLLKELLESFKSEREVHEPFVMSFEDEIDDALEWAIEQTERVQELEREIKVIEAVQTVDRKLLLKRLKQNKRYREALVRLRNDINKQETGYEKNVFVIKTVDDALIDWEALEG